jgi:DNA polymerase-3 subunit alpha
MAALLGVYRGKEDRVVGCIEECRRMGIDVVQPDVNCSREDFSIESDESGSKVRFGLGAIKGIGGAAIEGLLKARDAGPFTHLYDLAERAREQGGINKVALEALVKAGALDSIDPNRKKLLAVIETAVAFAEQANRDKAMGQDSLFGGEQEEHPKFPNLPEVPPATRRENLAMEKEVTGLYLSDHPLKGFERFIERTASHAAVQIDELTDGAQVTLAGVVAGIRQIRTKSKNELMATLTIEDMTGQAVVTVFPGAFSQYSSLIAKDRLVVVKGHTQHRDIAADGSKRVEVIARSIESLDGNEADDEDTEAHSRSFVGTITVQVLKATHVQLQRVRSLIESNPGDFELTLEVGSNGSTRRFETPYRVSDGPWVVELRRSLDQGFVKVDRRKSAFVAKLETA